jgi:TPR repeat protein
MRAFLLGLGLTLALAGLPTAVIAVSPVPPQAAIEAPAEAPTEAQIPSDDKKCSTCDGVRLMEQGDYGRAMHIFQLRAAEGDSVAMNNIGWMYEFGLGRAPDPRQAILWYSKAGDRGNGTSLFNLADMFDNGIGVQVDHKTARQYREKALRIGYLPALTWGGMLYLHGDGVPKNYGTAMSLFEAAAVKGDNLAMNEIGFMYQHGLGMKPDPSTAWCWYQLAILNGSDASNRHLQELKAAGTPPPSSCEVLNSIPRLEQLSQ